ncbi:SigE family RNA polymerase sigma factor [Kribbella amoyensis]|nr:SigE family RNA polymerase sigma factor [Kribbella amoyensis]
MEELPAATEFSDFVATRYGSLLGTAYALTQDRGLAEDLVQTTLAKCWRAWPTIDGADPGPYVRQVLVNTCRAWWRVKKGKLEFPTDELPATVVPVDHFARIEHEEVLTEALGRLPRRMRTVVVLRYLAELTEAEAAAVVGCSVGTVKSQSSRGLARLRVDPVLHEYGRPSRRRTA